MEFFGPWGAVPNGGALYRTHFLINVLSQDKVANKSLISWEQRIQKDRSYNGFYDYSANWNAQIDSANVVVDSGVLPTEPWPGWWEHLIAKGQVWIDHDADGTKTGIPLHAEYNGANSGWAPGALWLTTSFDLPKIGRASIPTVSPSPATVGTTVTILMPDPS